MGDGDRIASMQAINIAQKLSLFSDYFSPKIVGELNENYVKLAKFQGEFVWHHHQHEDELFLVIKGQFTMKLRTGDVEIRAGEFFIVPKGVEHCPSAKEEVEIMLIEPKGTLNTGNIENERTVAELQRI
jgi:mannose-6-phosphate isomerase-like protein (cupin superfamily)